MKVVGVKELKARLSEYLRGVRRGDTVLVTDRNEVVAELRPARGPAPPEHDRDPLDALIDAGEITPARVAKARWTWKARGLGLSRGTAQALLDELRGERSTD